MKILYFTNIPAPYRIEFFNLLSKDNDVTVLFDNKVDKTRNRKWFKNNNYKFKSIQLKKNAFFQYRKIFKEKYDAIVLGTYASFNGALFILYLRIKGIKFYLNADGGIIPEKESFISKFLKKMFISKATYYLSSGNETNKYLINYGAKERFIYLYPFTSLTEEDILPKVISYEEKMKIRKKMGYNYKRVFVSVGRFIRLKGYHMFIEAMKNNDYKDTAFIIIGGGELKEEYESLIEKYNISNIFLIDFCDKNRVFDYYKMADVFFFTSFTDVWGLVINEAMACGLPIISSNNVIASKELLSNDSLYQYNDIESLRNIINIYHDKTLDELEMIGNNNLKTISKYTLKNMAERHIEIFNENKERINHYEEK